MDFRILPFLAYSANCLYTTSFNLLSFLNLSKLISPFFSLLFFFCPFLDLLDLVGTLDLTTLRTSSCLVGTFDSTILVPTSCGMLDFLIFGLAPCFSYILSHLTLSCSITISVCDILTCNACIWLRKSSTSLSFKHIRRGISYIKDIIVVKRFLAETEIMNFSIIFPTFRTRFHN